MTVVGFTTRGLAMLSRRHEPDVSGGTTVKALWINCRPLIVLFGVAAGITNCSVKAPPQERITTDAYEIVDDYSGTEAGRYNNRGAIRLAEGDLSGAIEDFREAVKLDPQEPDYYENLGWALSTRGEHAKAFRNVEVAIRLRPKDAELYWKRGVIMGGWDGTAGRLTIFRQRSR
jgi:hypothetical protein